MLEKYKILIVDDDEEYLNSIKRLFTDKNHNIYDWKVQTAKSRDQSFKKLSKGKFDAIILDLEFGTDKNHGLTILKDILSIYTNACVVMLTNHGNFATVVQAIDIGAYNFFEKTTSFTILENGVAQAIRGHNLRLENDKHKNAQQKLFENRTKIKPVQCFKTEIDCAFKIKENPKLVFIAIPYTPNYYLKKYGLVKERLEDKELKMECRIANDKIMNTDIMCNVCQSIQEARYIIADVSDWNANVLFELGLACGMGKVTLIMNKRNSKVPVNLDGIGRIEYTNKNNLLSQVEQFFREQIITA